MPRKPKAPPKPVRKPKILVPSTKYWATSFGGSPDGVLPYVNLRFLPCWGTTDFVQIADEIRRTAAYGVTEVSLYVDWLMWDNSRGRYKYRDAVGVRALCEFLHLVGLLKYVKFWWLPDEPGRDKGISEADFWQCVLDLKALSTEYSELTGARFVAIWGYASDPRYASDLVHIQGLDNYDDPDGILRATEDMERGLGPEQYSMIVPGMYTLENKPLVIERFMEYMRWHPKCRMMCPFLYDPLQGGYSVNGSASRVLAVSKEVRSMNEPSYQPPVILEPEPLLEPPEPPKDTQQGS